MNNQSEDARIPGVLFVYDENSSLRNEFSVRLDPESGIIYPNEYIPRDSYDWVSDSIFFRFQDSDVEVSVEEGALVDFGVMVEDLPWVRKAWADTKARKMDGELPTPPDRKSGSPRL